MRLGVLGGTFDPVHVGHLMLAERAREQLALERVLWVPSGDPWRKTARRVAAAGHRVSMVELAIADNPAFKLSRLEVDRSGPSYSVETLAQLQERDPRPELVFILGLDALRDLPNWHNPARLVELATLAVAARAGRRLSGLRLERLLPGLESHVVWLAMPRLDVSATELRQRAAEGRSLRYLVPAAVEAYILEHALYAGQR